MRILRVHPFLKSEVVQPAAGGMARVSLQLTLALLQAGHEVRVLPIPERLFQSYPWMLDARHSVQVEPTLVFLSPRGLAKVAPRAMRLKPPSQNIREFLLDTMSLAALERAVRSSRPNIVHNHLARRPFPRLARAAGLHQPTVLTHHHGEPGECLEEYSRVVFNSRATRARIVEQSGLPFERTRVVYHPVDEIFLQETAAPRQSRSGIAFVGAIRERKGMDLILQAYASSAELQRHTLYCLGSGEALDRSRSFAERFHLPLVFEGQQPSRNVHRRLGGVIAAVIPSRLESFSRAVSESLCCGTPVIGWPDQIHETEELLGLTPGLGFDARVQSAEELAQAILSLLSSPLMLPEHRERLGRAAREMFTVDRFLQGYLSIYQELL
jgi:glycosyltransferase involved in cell wall biosynthesis